MKEDTQERETSTAGEHTLEAITESFLNEARQGTSLPIEQYAKSHPPFADEIRELFPVLLKLEKLAPAVLTDAPRAGLSEGRQIQQYRLGELIGKGGMAEVYRAEDTRIGRWVALKVVHHEEAEAHVRERFRHEAAAAGKLHHTNIVPVYDTGQAESCDYIAMQLIEGCSLAELIAQLHRIDIDLGWDSSASESVASPSDTKTRQGLIQATTRIVIAQDADTDVSVNSPMKYYRSIAAIGQQVAEAVEHTHSQGVLHRDLKPANILLDQHAHAWVTDFGLAKVSGESLTKTGDLVGTLSYLAPERLHGQCTPRSDVYSLGATLFSALAGRAPSHGHTGDASGIDRLPRKVPGDLAAIVTKCLAADPADRYASARRLADDLRRFLAGDAVQARHRAWTVQIASWSRKNPAFATFIGFFVAAVCATSIVSLFVASHLNSQNQELIETRNALRDQRDDLLQTKQLLTRANEELLRKLESNSRGDLLESWSEHLRINPNSYMAYISRGELYLNKTQEFDKAVADYERALEIMNAMGEDRPWGHYYNAQTCLAGLLVLGDEKHRDIERAIELAKPVVDATREWWTLRQLAYAYYHVERYQEVVDLLDETLIDIGDAPTPIMYYYRAMALHQLGRSEEAETSFQLGEELMNDAKFGYQHHRYFSQAQSLAKEILKGRAGSHGLK